MSGLGDKLTLGVTLPLGFAAKKVTDFASDLNESINATNVVFGEASGIIDRFAKDSARSMGLSERAFREAVTPMGAALQNLGFSQEAAADQSVKLSQRAADMASVFNTDVSTALDAINAGLRGESDPLEKFGVGLNEAAVAAEAVRLGLAKEGDELTANQKTQARLSLIMRQTNKIAGDFANTSGESANAQRVAAAEAENAAAAFGQKLLPVKLKLIRAATRLMDWFNNLSKGQQDLAIKAGAAVAALGPFLSITGRLARGISALVKVGAGVGRVAVGFGKFTVGFAKLTASAATAGAKVAGTLAQMAAQATAATAKFVAQIIIQAARWAWLGVQALLAAAKVAAAWLISLGPIGLVIAAVAGAAALIIANWDKIQRFVTTAARAVVDFLKKNWPLILAILTGPIGVAVLLIVRNWDRIKAVFRAGVDFVISLWQTAWNTVKSVIATAVSTILTTITSWRDRVIGVFANAVSWLLQAGRNIIKGLWQGALEIASQFFGYITRIPGRIRDTFAGAGRWLINAGKRILQGLWDGLKDKWKSVTDWIGGLGKKIIDLKGPPAKDLLMLRPAGRNIMQGFFEELKKGQGPIFNLMKRLGIFIAQFFAGRGVGGGALTGLEDRFEGIIRQILKLGRGQVRLVSGFRSSSQQARLYARYLAGTGNLAAPPGRSKHERGLAVDFGGNRPLYTRLAHQFGLVAPVRGEPWHWQPTWAGQTRSYYQRGAYRVPATGPAVVHRDEMIFPARLAAAIRALPGGPGGAGAAVVNIGPVNVYANTPEEGRAAAKGFLDVLARRRIQTDARIA